MRLTTLTILVALEVLIPSTEGKPLEADEWRTLDKRLVNGCQTKDIFAMPLPEGQNCIASVERHIVCEGGEKAVEKIEFIAMRENNKTECQYLDPEMDFFPMSVFGRDPTLMPLLRKAAKLLKREASQPSSKFRSLGHDVSNELRKKQMAALDAIRVDTSNYVGNESYELVFGLPKCRCVVVLYLSLTRSKYEWTRLIE